MTKQDKPQPVIVNTICSLCGEPWEQHGDKPTTLDCIRLLKAKVPVAPIVIQPYPLPNTVPVGYHCGLCGQWVYGYHVCRARVWYQGNIGASAAQPCTTVNNMPGQFYTFNPDEPTVAEYHTPEIAAMSGTEEQ